MLQTSFSRLAADAIPVLNRLKALKAEGRNIYYVVGNHDIVLEHFLEECRCAASRRSSTSAPGTGASESSTATSTTRSSPRARISTG